MGDDKMYCPAKHLRDVAAVYALELQPVKFRHKYEIETVEDWKTRTKSRLYVVVRQCVVFYTEEDKDTVYHACRFIEGVLDRYKKTNKYKPSIEFLKKHPELQVVGDFHITEVTAAFLLCMLKKQEGGNSISRYLCSKSRKNT